MTDTRPLAERVRDIAREIQVRADEALHAGLSFAVEWHRADATTLHEAADALEARKDQP
jgi:hypothetical protein